MQSLRNRQARHGVAAVEVALLLPIFMMLLLGIMDASRLY